jgi:hypothetical protein
MVLAGICAQNREDSSIAGVAPVRQHCAVYGCLLTNDKYTSAPDTRAHTVQEATHPGLYCSQREPYSLMDGIQCALMTSNARSAHYYTVITRSILRFLSCLVDW